MWDPQAIADLQVAARDNSADAYKRFAEHANDDARTRCALRGLLEVQAGANGGRFRSTKSSRPSEIVKRFCTGAMSFGSISAEAHETLAIAMNRIGGKSNTGEGGEDPERFKPLPNGDSQALGDQAGRVGPLRRHDLVSRPTPTSCRSRSRKAPSPAKAASCPAARSTTTSPASATRRPAWASSARRRTTTSTRSRISKQLIHDLKNANPSARVSVKLVSEVGVGTIAAGVAKGYADHILISGDTGGTGASPLTSIKHAGLPWELGIAETHQTLVMNDLRSRVVLQTDGGLKTGRDVVIAAMLGAEEFGFATAPLITLGCIMMRKCHLNTCPVGVATQDPVLRKKFAGKPEHVVNYLFMVAEEARADHGRARLPHDRRDGRPRRLPGDRRARSTTGRPTASTSRRCSRRPQKPHPDVEVYCTQKQDHGLELSLDNRADRACAEAASSSGKPVREELPIINTNRTVGTMLSHEIAKRWGDELLPDDTIHFKFTGSAGQSFGAFLAKGVTLELEGDANDYVGKGLSGGRLIIYPPQGRHVHGRGQHHHRQRRAVRRDERRGVLPRPRRRAVLRAQQRRQRGRSKASATTAAST